jgi:hypothetical protein
MEYSTAGEAKEANGGGGRRVAKGTMGERIGYGGGGVYSAYSVWRESVILLF